MKRLGSTPEKIPEEILTVLQDSSNALFLSAASSWDISIKYRLGKLPLPEPPARFIADRLIEHTTRVAELPDFHSDPFDRLLIAQAMIKKMALVTADEKLLPYEIERLKVSPRTSLFSRASTYNR